eukprot:4178889-Alexandrium_andersonii.AAC.1
MATGSSPMGKRRASSALTEGAGARGRGGGKRGRGAKDSSSAVLTPDPHDYAGLHCLLRWGPESGTHCVLPPFHS